MSLPTGEDKSLCYVSLPLAFYWLRERYVVGTSRSIVLVVSPLIALMVETSKRGKYFKVF